MARILLIDDDEDVRRALHGVLDRHGHTVIEASNGDEGLKLFPTVNADLVITDIVMPGKSGLDVLRELCASHAPVKAIAISGGSPWGFEGGLELARALGAAKVLAKPFSCDDLLGAVNALLADGGANPRGLAP